MNSRTLAPLCVLLGTLVTVHAAEVVQLFNGRNLDGWTFDVKDDADPKDIWSAQDGILICKGRPAGVIRTEAAHGNYELTLQWRWPAGTERANSGCLIHVSTPRELDIWPKSLEVQLGKGDAGDFWAIGETIEVPPERKPASGRRIPNLTDNSERPAGEWNTLRIRCEGRSVIVWVNGDKVNEGMECSASNGAIGLQSEGTEIHFRKVELRPLN